MVYYCKIVDDDKSYTIHGPYTLEEMKYAISLKNISVNDWFAKLNEADAAKKPLKINTWLPANSFDEFHNSFYPPWSMADIFFSTANSKNVPFGVQMQFGFGVIGLTIVGLLIIFSLQKSQTKINLNEIFERTKIKLDDSRN